MSDTIRVYETESPISVQKVCQMINDGRIKDFPLLTPHDDYYGQTSTLSEVLQLNSDFNNRLTFYTLVLSDGRLLLTYNIGDTFYATYITIDGTTITFGQKLSLAFEASLQSVVPYYIADDRIMVSYCVYKSSTYYQYVAIILISSGVMALGTPKEIAYYLNYPMVFLNSAKTHAYVLYWVNNSNLYVISFSISAITLTQITPATQISSGVDTFVGRMINDNFLLISYKNGSDQNNYVQDLSLNNGYVNIGNSVPTGIPASSDSNICGEFFLDDDTILQIGMYYYSGSYRVAARVLKLDFKKRIPVILVLDWQYSTTLLGPGSHRKAFKINSQQAQLVYETYIASPESRTLSYVMINYDKVANTITFGNRVELYANAVRSINIIDMGAPKPSPIFYIKNISPYYTFQQFLSNQIVTNKELRSGKAVGLVSDASGSVFLKGIYKGFANLEVGKKYYFDNTTGAISTTSAGGTFLGIALSTNELKIPDIIF